MTENDPDRVSDNSNQAEQPETSATRMRFMDEVKLNCHQAAELLVGTVPELHGIIFTFIWDYSINAAAVDFGMIRGRDVTSPRFKLRAAEQVYRQLQWQMQALYEDLKTADRIAQELNKELDGKRRELDELNTRIDAARNAAGSAPRAADDTPAAESP